MEKILEGLVLINGIDIWTEYGAFLVEDTRGGMDNITEILTPSKLKSDTAVDFREENGETYPDVLSPRNEARNVTLNFAIFAESQAEWMKRYFTFVAFVKNGSDGWIRMDFPQIGLALRLKYAECTKFSPLTYLWKEGIHAAKFKVKFREPLPVI